MKKGYFKSDNPFAAILLTAIVLMLGVVIPSCIRQSKDNRVTITYLGPTRFQDAIGKYLSEEGFGDRMRHVHPNETPDITVRALSMEAWSLFSEKSHNDLASAFSWVDKTSEKYEVAIEGESAEFEFGWDREKGKLIPMTFPGNFAIKAIIQKELEKFEAKKRGS